MVSRDGPHNEARPFFVSHTQQNPHTPHFCSPYTTKKKLQSKFSTANPYTTHNTIPQKPCQTSRLRNFLRTFFSSKPPPNNSEFHRRHSPKPQSHNRSRNCPSTNTKPFKETAHEKRVVEIGSVYVLSYNREIIETGK